jgi:multiple sugar transport system permease protein
MATSSVVKTTKKDYNWGGFRLKAAPYVFTAPFFIAFLIFSSFPLVFSTFLSFQEWNGVRQMKFAGIDNYFFLIQDPLFLKSILNTIILMLMCDIPQHVLALFFAFILNSAFIKFREFFKGAFFLPYVTSSVAVAIVFGILFGMQYGFINYLLSFVFESPIMKSLFGGSFEFPINFGVGWAAKTAVSTLAIWKWTGWITILYLAGLQAIPESLYEAARVDGATWPQVFFHITIPLLKPIMFFAITMSIIGSMQFFDEPLVLLGDEGGVNNTGFTATMFMYKSAFAWGEFGRAAAASYILFVVILFLSFINNMIFKDRDRV